MNLNYEMPRDEFQNLFAEWLEDNGFDSYGYADNSNLDRGGFENEVFLINPYYWGDDEEIAEQPNFIYKPENIIIEWYKYPFRSSYSNYNFKKLDDLEAILIECSKSMGNQWREAEGVKDGRLNEILNEMKSINNDYDDTEIGHIYADNLLCKALEILGQKELVEAFYDVDKWYS